MFLAVGRKRSADYGIWLNPQHCRGASFDQLDGSLSLSVCVGADGVGVAEGQTESGGACHGDCSSGNIGKCGGGVSDDYVPVPVYDLWVSFILYRLFSSAYCSGTHITQTLDYQFMDSGKDRAWESYDRSGKQQRIL